MPASAHNIANNQEVLLDREPMTSQVLVSASARNATVNPNSVTRHLPGRLRVSSPRSPLL